MLSEVQTYLDRLSNRRGEILKSIQGLSATELEWTPPAPDTNSLGILAVHTLGAERRWLHTVVGGMKIEQDREAEFHTRAPDMTALAAQYAAAAQESERILAALTAEDLDARRFYRNREETVRWCILHVLEHYNEHLGQMWLTRQLYENSRRA